LLLSNPTCTATHWEVATAQLLGAAEAFQRAPPEAIRRTAATAATATIAPGDVTDDVATGAAANTTGTATATAPASAAVVAAAAAAAAAAADVGGVPAAVAAAWGEARRGTEELLLAVLRSLVGLSVQVESS
jgi:hypothetical protein